MLELSDRAKRISARCDQIITVSLYALVFCIPISNALVEWCFVVPFFTWIFKRSVYFNALLKSKKSPANNNVFHKFCDAYKPHKNYLNHALGLYILVTFISVVFSQHPGLSLKSFVFKYLQNIYIFFMCVECLNTKKKLKTFFSVFFISFVLIAINGFVQYFTGKGIILQQVMWEGRITSSLRHANDYGAYLISLTPLFFFLFFSLWIKEGEIRDEKILYSIFGNLNILRFVFLIVFLLSISNLGLTYSRGAWLSFIISMFLVSLKYRKLFIPIIITSFTFLIIFFQNLMSARTQFNDITDLINNNNRVIFWDGPIKIINDYPWFGSGLNTYSRIIKNYEVNFGGYPHNCYLQLTAEQGIIGLVFFLWVIISLFKTAFANLNKIKNNNLMFIGILTGVLGLFIQGFFDTTFYSLQLASLHWLFIGLLVNFQLYDFSNDKL